jgi:putative phosphoribosyl transferase
MSRWTRDAAGGAGRWGRATVPFRDRDDAGTQLAARCLHLADPHQPPTVLGLPRGGVPVAAHVAAAVDAPLDVLVVRKIGCPWQPELGVGAIGEEGEELLDAGLLQRLGLTRDALAPVLERERAELERRVERYRSGRPLPATAGRTVILVDDGIATGGTIRAAIDVLRARGAGRIVVAVPVAAADVVASLRPLVDEVVVLYAPSVLGAVGSAYVDFSQTSDAEVSSVLERSIRTSSDDGQ